MQKDFNKFEFFNGGSPLIPLYHLNQIFYVVLSYFCSIGGPFKEKWIIFKSLKLTRDKVFLEYYSSE